MRRAYYLASLIIPISICISFYAKGLFSFFALFVAFVLLPTLELLLPTLTQNVSIDETEQRKHDRFFDLILWITLPIQFGLLIYFCTLLESSELASFETLGLISAMGIGCGIMGINAAHELGHRNNKYDQAMAKLLLSTSLYWHFFIEHNKGPHKNVSTPQDPASARLNEPVYTFYVRSIVGSFISAWHIEKKNCHRLGQRPWSLHNEVIRAMGFQAALIAMIYLFFGERAVLGFLASALVGVLLLETVNYIEHYGLRRKEIAPERYEKTQPYHSWNADNPFSRAVLFDLSRHSDHHYNAAKKYQNLLTHENAPQLPTGYPGMMLLALIPPLWFRVMNPKVLKSKELT
jgi:alkane 1-monooxygenase